MVYAEITTGLRTVQIRAKTSNCRWFGDLNIYNSSAPSKNHSRCLNFNKTRQRSEGGWLLGDTVRYLRLLAVFAVTGKGADGCRWPVDAGEHLFWISLKGAARYSGWREWTSSPVSPKQPAVFYFSYCLSHIEPVTQKKKTKKRTTTNNSKILSEEFACLFPSVL